MSSSVGSVEFPPIWGACAFCQAGVSYGGFVVWDKAVRFGLMSCGLHLLAVKSLMQVRHKKKPGAIEAL